MRIFNPAAALLRPGPFWTALPRIATAAIAGLLLLAACTTPPAKFPARRYVPVTREMQAMGELVLSNTELRLGSLEGEMKLQYVGLMQDKAGKDLAGATVYRVKNADQYFKKNTGRQGYCAEAPKWVAVNSETGAPAWSTEIWVAFLTVEDWSEFTPTVHRYCAGGVYVRTAD
jgi:hypothetical protein